MLKLLFARVRRDRIILPIWILGATLLAYAGASGVKAEFGTDADRETILKVALATPSLLALRGAPDGPTLGSYVYFQVITYVCLLAAFMTTFLVTRHTRADEERGRAELVRATPIRRTTPLAATLVLGAAANGLLGLGVAVGFIAGGLEPRGSWVAGLAVASVGFVFLGVAAVVAQLAPTSRGANGISAALVGLAFLLRAAGDATGTPDFDAQSLVSAWPSWLSPIGWAQQVFAFTRADLAPLWLSLGAFVLTIGMSLVVESRRDLGASVLRERQGRASGGMRSSLALAWRQQWPTVVGWALGGAALGALAGSLGQRIADEATGVSATLQQILESFIPGGTGQLIDLFVVAIMSIAGICAAAAGVQAIIRARGEEADGRVELVLAAPVRKTSWFLGWLLIAVVSVTVVAMSAAVVAALAFLGTGADADRVASTLLAGIAQLPAALSLVAVAALVFAVVPRATVWLGWVLIALAAMIGQFGGLLQLPDWLRDASPFAYTPVVPGVDPDWSGAVVLLLISVVLIAAATAVLRRRQLTS